MAVDALDPGPDDSYPYLPRNPDGTLDVERFKLGLSQNRGPDGRITLVDLEALLPDGRHASDVVPLPPTG